MLDGSSDIFKLSTLEVLSINLIGIMTIPWEHWESNPKLLGDKRERYLFTILAGLALIEA